MATTTTATNRRAALAQFASRSARFKPQRLKVIAANLRTKILDFRGFDSSRILILRDGILVSIGNLQEILSRRILVGIILVGRLGAAFVAAA